MLLWTIRATRLPCGFRRAWYAAVQRVKDGQGVGAVAGESGMSARALRNWLNASEAGKLNGLGAKIATAEQMELSTAIVRRSTAVRPSVSG